MLWTSSTLVAGRSSVCSHRDCIGRSEREERVYWRITEINKGHSLGTHHLPAQLLGHELSHPREPSGRHSVLVVLRDQLPALSLILALALSPLLKLDATPTVRPQAVASGTRSCPVEF